MAPDKEPSLPCSLHTGGYFDVLATLPALVPQGTMGILGLGAGTLPRMVQWYHPGQRMVGWELDAAVVMAARMHMGEYVGGWVGGGGMGRVVM